jgi:hypothetical protein
MQAFVGRAYVLDVFNPSPFPLPALRGGVIVYWCNCVASQRSYTSNLISRSQRKRG